jgi:hypothetical protein
MTLCSHKAVPADSTASILNKTKKIIVQMQLIPFDPKLENVPFGNINEQVHEIGNQTILETPN